MLKENKHKMTICTALFLLTALLFSSCSVKNVETNIFDDVEQFFADKTLLKLSVLMDKMGIKKTEFKNITFSSDGEKNWYYQNHCKSHYSEDKNILVFEMSSYESFGETVFVIFEKRDAKYLQRDYLESSSKYEHSLLSFWPKTNNIPVFSITSQSGGTGCNSSTISFYQYKTGKAAEMLNLKLYDRCSTCRIPHEYKGEISFSEKEIKVVYDINVSAIGGYYESAYKDIPWKFNLFKTTRESVYKWSTSKQKYIYDPASQVPEQSEDLFNDKSFVKYFKSELAEVKKTGDKYQREWVEKMFGGN
ncbi:MAG: hypothetical protein A2044_08775 [Candidatus Firestonebacteria bacterium GWA2_43_8]|nr:MAG: hypothetical protein A2044_08775 [Candidatus Firestonebacteria bacterium GWA2_43_8]